MPTPEAAIAALDGRFPVALLPVRIETRFADGDRAVHVRVFPDQIHVDAHEPELTDDEVAAGRAYWERRWPSPGDATVAREAWATVAAAMRPGRARWVVEATRPTNDLGSGAGPDHREVARRASTWTRPATAVALPTRWVAVGRRGGRELFRVWSDPVAPALQVAPSPDVGADTAGPLGDAGLRWLAEPEAARRAGVLLTVRDADLPGGARLRDGLDELVVVGVDWTRTPEGAADLLDALLAAHVYAEGLAFVPQGTPTNNTEAVASGHTSDRQAAVDALDPTAGRARDGTWSAAPRLARALGLAGRGVALAQAPGGHLAEHAVASALLDATWEATAGTYLGQLLRPVGRRRPLLSDEDIDELREWAAAHLFAAGPLPAMRVGRQPYGFLPVVAPARYRPSPGDRAAQLVHDTATRLRPWWVRGAASAPRLDGGGDVDAALVEILQRSPVAATARFRRVLPAGGVVNLAGLDDLFGQQHLHSWLVTSMFRGSFDDVPLRIATLTTDPRSHALRVPWARPAGLAAGAPLPYVADLRGLLGVAGGRDRLAARQGATSLAEALLALSAALELDAAHGRVVKGFAADLLDSARVRYPDTIGIGTEAPAGDAARRFGSPRALAGAVVPGLTGSRTVADHVRDVLGPVLTGTGTRPGLDGVGRLVVALDRLRDEPGERVEWALRGLLDLYAYRLDAWCTGLATQRLAELRRARPHGVHVGCFGWVEGLRPDPPGRESLGYVHTPSLDHAVAAAVLRSGHVAHRGTAQQALAVDLSARRVRIAMTVLEGVEGGQPLGALLGYRLERLLRERDALLMRYVLPLRRLAPLRHTDAELTEPVESLAARDVVDAVALLERWRAPGGREAVLGAAGVVARHRAAVSETLDAVDDVFDAVGDVLLSEAVYQTVRGNHDRARAALGVLDRQQRPVQPEVVRTPRSGTTVTHRVLVALSERGAGDWSALRDPRGDAEPRLNAWVARLLGDPRSIVFAGEVRREGADPRTVTVTAADLRLSPLALVLAARRAAGDRPSELETRVAVALAATVSDASENDRLVLLDDAPDGAPDGAWGLGAVRAVATWVGRLAAARAGSARDLGPLLDDQPPGYDVDELARRADRAVAALAAVVGGLERATGVPAALERAARLGIIDALPSAAPQGDRAAVVRASARAAQAREAAAVAIFAGRPDATDEQRVEHHTERLRIVFGEGFPALPLFRAADPGSIAASAADRTALLDGDDLAPLAWLHRAALVRPAVEPLSSLLTVAEAAGRAIRLPQLDVVQLPHEPGQRWVALPPAPGGDVAAGAVGVVAHAAGAFDPRRQAAVLVVDEWTETVPADATTTALSFHYDAPAARPPQAVLFAVPGEWEMARWSLDALLDTVREAVALTHIRAVGPRELSDLGGYLPAIYVPQDVTGDVPSTDLFDLADRARLAGIQADVLGKG